jgi:hypothetical protein
MAYTPKFLLPTQIADESGGHQFDQQGKPLTSSKGAIGIAQVMPATGPQAAQLAGVPWDENRYKNDRDYNLQIGDAYQGHLNTIFNGHQLAATAAYNAGPTRVLRLKQQYGDNWASYLPPETKQYVKKVLGVNVDGQPDAGVSANIKSISESLGIPLYDGTPGKPTSGEQTQVNLGTELSAGPNPDTKPILDAAGKASTSSERYSTFLNGAIQPIVQNMAAQTAGMQRIATVKTGLANDFRTRETDLESKIQPLLAKRQQISDQIAALDQLSPLDRRLKSIFNPMRYDPRMLRGQLERVEGQISTLDSNYKELNNLRSGVAAASVDAETADIGTLEAGRQSTIAEATLLGQVAGATKEQVAAALLPMQVASQTASLQEHQRTALLGRLTSEETHALFNEAQAAPDGTVTVQGMKFTVGDLQHADQANQQVDLSLHSLVNASRVNDLMTADKVEDVAISHMSLEQVSQALADQGMFRGVKMDMGKLTAALGTLQQGRQAQVAQTLGGTAEGQAHDIFAQQSQLMSGTRQRVVEMFGNMPGDWSQFEQQVTGLATSWTTGHQAARAKGVGAEYTATTLPQLQAMRTQYDKVIDGIATKWSGGNTNLKDVASAYLRGDPINGDSAIKGLIAIANSGMPAGAKLSGPAAQAVEAARSIVREFNNPQPGDSLSAMLAGNQTKAEKDQALVNKVRAQVGAVYANALTDGLIQSFPSLARQVPDPTDPRKPHPFSQVNPDDFKMAIAHGDNSGYEVMGNQMGVAPAVAKSIFQKGIDSPEWQAVAKAKNWTNDRFSSLLGALQSIQMSETLSALDASHSSHPGFSPAKAYADFLQAPEVQNRIDKAVNSYGRSSFGSFLVSGAAGGGYRDNWTAYTQAIANQYFLNNGRNLQQRIKQQRSIGGDPFVRFNAINQSAGLTPQESQLLMQNVRPLVQLNTNGPDQRDVAMPGVGVSMGSSYNFDAVANIVRNHKFDDPQVERIRKKVANQWDAMDALVGTVFNSVSE